MKTEIIDKEVSLTAYFRDIFNSFEYNKDKIHEQIRRDIYRMNIHINGLKYNNISDYYRLINNLKCKRIIKRLLWVLPTQVSLAYFYIELANHYKEINSSYIISEIPDKTLYNNEFRIVVDFLDNTNFKITLQKNFRILEQSLETDEVSIVGYILLNIKIELPKNPLISYSWEVIT